jgi:antitoxin component of MazEF toxin-antitoxin module
MSGNPTEPIPGFETKLRKTGSAVGATIPADFLRRLGLKAGDKVTVGIDGEAIKIVAHDPDFAADLILYDMIADRFAPALRQLDDA